jgi:hypothetical protein
VRVASVLVTLAVVWRGGRLTCCMVTAERFGGRIVLGRIGTLGDGQKGGAARRVAWSKG